MPTALDRLTKAIATATLSVPLNWLTPERDTILAVAKYWPGFDPLHGDPRWDEFLQKMGLT